MIALPQPAEHPADKCRQGVKPRSNLFMSAIVIGRGGQSIKNAVSQLPLGCLGFSEFDDARVHIRLGDAATLGIGRRKGVVMSPPWERWKERKEHIDVAEVVGVDDEGSVGVGIQLRW